MVPWLIIMFGYLLGSLPTASITGYIFIVSDVRRMGEYNPGAANACRELGSRAVRHT
jgi:glycerol-3-phosphate acyltransferase PlsY